LLLFVKKDLFIMIGDLFNNRIKEDRTGY